jgi:cellobiose phosphorylase
MEEIRRKEWLNLGFFNGYYDNKGLAVEGRRGGILKMMLASQVFAVMSGVAEDKQIKSILESVRRYLRDKNTGGIHLNTNFYGEQPELGRAFFFAYGDKENGAYFNHMIVLFAYALYQRGYADDAWKVLCSIYNMSCDTPSSKIYPCIPEYFNLEGRGMYSYLTGSASWFILTMLTEAFGVKGKQGDLLIKPKLSREQFRFSDTISINRIFAGKRIKVTFTSTKSTSFNNCKIISASLDNEVISITDPRSIVIKRNEILKLTEGNVHHISILLG